MGTVELAEKKARARAAVFYVFAALVVLLLLGSFGAGGSDLLRGMWVGVTASASINLMPLGRWLKPNSAVARLLDDESTREHRRTSSVAGFWAAVIAAIAMAFVTADPTDIAGFDVARVIATAAVTAALVSFATLELRAGRG